MHKKSIIAFVVAGILFGGASIAAAVSSFPYAVGGTGTSTAVANRLIYSGATNYKNVAPGTNGQALFQLNGIPTWATASTSNGTVTSIATTFPIIGGPITTSGTLTFGGLSTTTPWTQGGVAVAGANQNSLYTAATTTLSGSGVITVTSGASVLGASPITVACPTCSTTTGTVTSIAFGDGLNGGTITTSGSVNLKSYFATSTTDTAGYVAYSNTTSGWPAKFSYVATSSQTLSSAFSSSGSFGNLISGSSGILSSVIQPSFTYATSTTWTGTTTIALQTNIQLAETLNGFSCNTGWPGAGGTLNIQFGTGVASTTLANASSTANFNANTLSIAAGSRLLVTIGTPATTPTSINCTTKITI